MRRRKNSTTLEEFDKTQLVDKELVDKISLWILRIIFNLGGAREFIDNNNRLYRDSLAYFLEVGAYVDMDSDEYKRSDILAVLKKNHIKLEKRVRFTSSKILTKNIQQISKLMNLNSVEEQILEFIVLVNQYDVLDDATDLLGNNLNTTQAKKAIGIILAIDTKAVNEAFKSTSKLAKSSIVTISKSSTFPLGHKIEIISDEFADNMLNLDEDISVMLKESVKPCDISTLKLEDYEHIEKDIDIVLPYLDNAMKNKKNGVNILLYGLPGTGKTELAKTISETLQTKLFEISYTDEDDEAIDGYKRLKAYKTAQSLLSNQNILLMYDEAEDIFDSSESPLSPKRQDNKAWLNRMLETNTIPTIWITNNIYRIDNAMVRRFDFSIEVPIPNKSKRAKIIKNYSNNLLDEQSIKVLAENENIAPALITRATKVVSSIDTDDKPKAFTQVLNNTLKAQGYKEIQEKIVTLLPNVYDPKFINTTTDLEVLTQGIKEHQNARLCLYGAAGTGKSAFGRYIAETLNKPLLLKKGSDLISMWVGGTEKNIAKAFAEAKEEKAVLVFDEVDSFLADRTGANQSWEVTQVNEMLVQMENFEGIFIATTNLIDNLDKASLRRFDLKLEFDFLKAEQSWKMFLSYCKDLKLAQPSISFKRAVESLKYLTPGDFAAVTRQNRFRPITDVKDFIQRLEDEIAVKNVSNGNVMGFLA
ncbi:AAA family ATPase [Sulfurimonas paralvinellae]|uniref:AAA family ATPase n=1 Tax=Sulfurimonas paralvinellae TaxID=317658 RepID=A0A7M1BAM5_9BACT|nr:AAA family ATPase [Sulfurimonas paralvinellae]QOP45878.1 AAA family ATPase [Sulfurimonas paralvinellae]